MFVATGGCFCICMLQLVDDYADVRWSWWMLLLTYAAAWECVCRRKLQLADVSASAGSLYGMSMVKPL